MKIAVLTQDSVESILRPVASIGAMRRENLLSVAQKRQNGAIFVRESTRFGGRAANTIPARGISPPAPRTGSQPPATSGAVRSLAVGVETSTVETAMTALLSLSDLNTSINHEPRVLDTRLGEALGLAQPRNIRSVIAANIDELKNYGLVHAANAPITSGKGRVQEIVEYWLNEPQALLLCMFSRTEKAAEVRKALIEVFMAYRKGAVVEKAAEAKFTGLTFGQIINAASHIGWLVAKDNPELCQHVMDWAHKRLAPRADCASNRQSPKLTPLPLGKIEDQLSLAHCINIASYGAGLLSQGNRTRHEAALEMIFLRLSGLRVEGGIDA